MSDIIYLIEGKINTSKEGIEYWSKKIKCPENDLKNSVLKIGNSYHTLILYMEMNQLIQHNE